MLWKVRVIRNALLIFCVSSFLALPASFPLPLYHSTPVSFTISLFSSHSSPHFPLIFFLPPLSLTNTLRAPGHLAGPTRTTSLSARLAWTSLPAGLAPCPCSIPRWGWIRFCSKTRCPYCGRSTGTSRGYNLPEPPRSLDTTETERGGGHLELHRCFP